MRFPYPWEWVGRQRVALRGQPPGDSPEGLPRWTRLHVSPWKRGDKAGCSVVCQRGRLHVAWADGRVSPPRLSYATSGDGGEFFSGPEIVLTAPEGCDLQGAALAVAADGTAYAAVPAPPAFGRRGPTHLWLATRAPGAAGWSRAEKVSGTGPCANPYLTADDAGGVYLSWLRYRKDEFDILCRFRTAAGWSEATNATRDGLWEGYAGGHLAVDGRRGLVYVATDDTPGRRHQVYMTTPDLGPPAAP